MGADGSRWRKRAKKQRIPSSVAARATWVARSAGELSGRTSAMFDAMELVRERGEEGVGAEESSSLAWAERPRFCESPFLSVTIRNKVLQRRNHKSQLLHRATCAGRCNDSLSQRQHLRGWEGRLLPDRRSMGLCALGVETSLARAGCCCAPVERAGVPAGPSIVKIATRLPRFLPAGPICTAEHRCCLSRHSV